MNAICENCKWFASGHANDEHGQCRRYPPRVIVSGNARDEGGGGESDDIDSLWPWVAPDHWCGEWQTHDARRQ